MLQLLGLAYAAGWDERKPNERIRPPPVITRNVSEATRDVAVTLLTRRVVTRGSQTRGCGGLAEAAGWDEWLCRCGGL
jgi:hypothetical protein